MTTNDAFDQQQIRSFWNRRAMLGDNRWTGKDLLNYEHDLIATRVRERGSILDLGSGYGALSRSLRPPGGTALGVDWEDQYSAGFTGPGEDFVTSDVLNFRTSKTFDLILLFGVVTYLTLEQEELVYLNLSEMLNPTGVCAVKNQCSIETEFQVNRYSEELGERYVGRYPGVEEQYVRLISVFPEVETVYYHDRYNPWANTKHVAFFCRKTQS